MVIIGKCTAVFSFFFLVWEEGLTWVDLFMDEFIMREENFHEGDTGFSSIIKQKQ